MARNLRDKGYPQAKTTRVNKSNKKNAVMNNQVEKVVDPIVQRNAITPTAVNPEKDNLINKIVTAYNSRAFGNPSAPLLQRTAEDITNVNGDEGYMSGMALRKNNGDRIGTANKVTYPGETQYNLAIDNLPFGGNYYDKEISTPVGDLYAEYDGDGTLGLSYTSSPNVYYLQSLINSLTNRGNL